MDEMSIRLPLAKVTEFDEDDVTVPCDIRRLMSKIRVIKIAKEGKRRLRRSR